MITLVVTVNSEAPSLPYVYDEAVSNPFAEARDLATCSSWKYASYYYTYYYSNSYYGYYYSYNSKYYYSYRAYYYCSSTCKLLFLTL